jgi:hypothetical protein
MHLLLRAREDAAAGRHYLRGAPGQFRASDGFVTAFKRRQRLSSHRTKLIRSKPPVGPARDTERECFDFVSEARDAVMRLGPSMVLNMDETPVQICDAGVSGITSTASGQPAPIRTDYLQKVSLTCHNTCMLVGSLHHSNRRVEIIRNSYAHTNPTTGSLGIRMQACGFVCMLVGFVWIRIRFV